MQSVTISELRANLKKILNQIERGSSVTITSKGRVVAKLIPPEESVKMAEERLVQIRKTAKTHDILSPVW